MAEKKDSKSSSLKNRRNFIKLVGATGGAALLTRALPWGSLLSQGGQTAGSQDQSWFADTLPLAKGSFLVTQTPLPGKSIPKYVDPMPQFYDAATNTNLRVNASAHPSLRINNTEFQEKILPASVYAPLASPFNVGSYVWGYQLFDAITNQLLRPANYPAFTIEATRDKALSITYESQLTTTVLQSYLTVDQTVHWANPLNIPMDSALRRQPYYGPVPVVTHLHGGEVASESDGGPDAWFTSTGGKGPAYTYGGVTQNYTYPNKQEATTLFYHDHCLGATRLNLYAGLVGFYLIRDQFDTGLESNPLKLPAGKYEAEIAIQDKMFDTNGQLLFPDGYPAGMNGPPPNPDIHPFWNPEFFGDAIVVNGKTWPYMDVEPRRYRFRIVDGANARFFRLFLDTKLPFFVIGTDGGLLDKPVRSRNLLIAPGERVDVIVDFAGFAGKTVLLTNSAKAPFPAGTSPDPNTIGQIMQFRVGTTVTGGIDNSFDPSVSGATIRGGAGQPSAIVRLSNSIGGLGAGVTPSVKRMLTLKEVPGPGGPIIVLCNNTEFEGKRLAVSMDTAGALMLGDPIPGSVPVGPNYHTELPVKGATEQWDIINLTADAHPIHIHLVQFQLINRQDYNKNS